ncbi:MAG: cysteine desulfurase [Nitriliruptoraceae bacterium]|jgi:cysteine desulfurase
MQPIHLDYAASTPTRPEVMAAFLDASARCGGNPGAGHAGGRSSRTVLEEARELISAALGRSPHEVVFTSGGTEADQLAVLGTFRAAAEHGRRHIVVSGVEHPAVSDAVAWLAAHEGARVTTVPPEGVAPVAVHAVLDAIGEDTAVVAVTAADSELGVRQHAGLAAAVVERGVPVHSDAVQAVVCGEVPPVGSLALSGHKLGAPVGIGIAVLPRDVPVRPMVDGPGQERGLRSGTQPAALAWAMAVALEMTVSERPAHAARCATHTSALATALMDVAGMRPTVPVDAAFRLASHLHLSVDGVDPEALATALDACGVHTSAGTACATGTTAASPVLLACGVGADATLRLTVGRGTTSAEIVTAADRIRTVVTQLRASGGGFL